MTRRLRSRSRSCRLAAVLVALTAGGALLTSTPLVRAQSTRTEKVQGYAEWRQGDLLVIDGQRVRVTAATRKKLKDARDVSSLPLGFEVEAEGVRGPDGVLIASRIDAKPNGTALFETDVRAATDEVEAQWLTEREVTQPKADGGVARMGRIIESGPQVDRVQRLTDRLLPPYVARDQVRVHVVDQKEWNAMAMGNGAVWVFTGLLQDMDDDEVAIVIGHELTHYTHEHSRKGMRRAMWAQIAAAGAAGAAQALDSRKAQAAVGVAALLSVTAWQKGYGREMEDQADRVGLRYAYEGGFDVRKGPHVWQRFREKYGQENRLTNFFFSDHSQAEARERNLNRELQLNYPDARPRRR